MGLGRIGLGYVGEFLGTDTVEAERDVRFAILLVEPGSRIGQPVAGDHDPLLDHYGSEIFAFGALLARQEFVADRCNAVARRTAAVGGLIDQLEGHFRSLAEHGGQARGVAEAWNLDHDPVVALAFDRRLARTHLVDAAAHDFDRLIDDFLLRLLLVGVGHLQREGTVAVVAEIIGLATAAQHAAGRGIKRLD